MTEEQSKQIRKILKTDLKEFLKIMKDNELYQMRVEDEDKILGVSLNCYFTRKDAVKEFNDKVDKCLKKIDKLEDIKSHMVGRFYIGTNKDGELYKSGEKVEKGQVVGFIETMNIRHDIKAGSDCEIINILVDNGKVVEYGQPIMQYKIN